MNRESHRAIVQYKESKDFPDSCEVCGWVYPGAIKQKRSPLHVHHIVPTRYGGKNNVDNFIVLCPNCHSVLHANWYYGREVGKALNSGTPLTREAVINKLEDLYENGISDDLTDEELFS